LSANAARVEVPYRIVGIIERETGPFGGTAAVSGLMIPLGRAKAIAAASRALQQALVPERASERTYNALIVKVKHAQLAQDVERAHAGHTHVRDDRVEARQRAGKLFGHAIEQLATRAQRFDLVAVLAEQ
jgi:hypothetical protein